MTKAHLTVKRTWQALTEGPRADRLSGGTAQALARDHHAEGPRMISTLSSSQASHYLLESGAFGLGAAIKREAYGEDWLSA